MTDDKLVRLKARREALLKEAKTLNDDIKKEEKKKQAAQRKANRTADTRRKVLIGAMELKKAENNPQYKAALYKELDSYLDEDRDRELFGLPPRQKTKQPAPSENKNEPVSREAMYEENDELV